MCEQTNICFLTPLVVAYAGVTVLSGFTIEHRLLQGYARWEIEKPTGNSSLLVLSSDSLVRIECVESSATMIPPERMTERSQSSYAYGRS